MALVRAEHDTFGVVEVPEKYLERWPDDYKPTDKAEASDAEPPAMFTDMTVEQLRDLLESRGLPTDGKKADLITRLSE